MPYKTPELAVSSSVVKWAISTAGYKPCDVAERLDISRELIQAWEKESGCQDTRSTDTLFLVFL